MFTKKVGMLHKKKDVPKPVLQRTEQTGAALFWLGARAEFVISFSYKSWSYF